MAIWTGLFAAAALSSISLAAQGDDPVRNQCRAECGAGWLTAAVCKANPDAVAPVKPIRCRKLADRAYKACLTSCDSTSAQAETSQDTASVEDAKAGPVVKPE